MCGHFLAARDGQTAVVTPLDLPPPNSRGPQRSIGDRCCATPLCCAILFSSPTVESELKDALPLRVPASCTWMRSSPMGTGGEDGESVGKIACVVWGGCSDDLQSLNVVECFLFNGLKIKKCIAKMHPKTAFQNNLLIRNSYYCTVILQLKCHPLGASLIRISFMYPKPC